MEDESRLFALLSRSFQDDFKVTKISTIIALSIAISLVCGSRALAVCPDNGRCSQNVPAPPLKSYIQTYPALGMGALMNTIGNTINQIQGVPTDPPTDNTNNNDNNSADENN